MMKRMGREMDTRGMNDRMMRRANIQLFKTSAIDGLIRVLTIWIGTGLNGMQEFHG